MASPILITDEGKRLKQQLTDIYAEIKSRREGVNRADR